MNIPSNEAELMMLAVREVHRFVDLAKEKLGVQISYPKVRFSITGKTGGKACSVLNIVHLNKTLLIQNAEHYLKQTCGHEVAHLIADAKCNERKHHGPEWKHVMIAFGLPPKRCHNYDVSTVPTMLGKVSNHREVKPITIEGGKMLFTKVDKVITFD